ncbi:MAG: translation initiation factor IF-2 [Bacteroidales bacterium]|jgi:translation initiation factor IF-2|nr:translation initiation factor IF-2 [Bacteroidales bacterium]
MAASTKQQRLSKIAKEFNLGISTIVEFLEKKGIEIDTNPNSKVPEESYELLIKEFGDQITVKEKSKEVSQQIRERRQERVGASKDEEAEPVSEPPETADSKDEPEDEVLITDNTSTHGDTGLKKEKEAEPTAKKVDKKEEAPKETPKPEEKKSEPAAQKEDKTPEKESTPKAEKPKEEEKASKTPYITKPTESSDDDSIKVLGKINLEDLNQKTRPKKKSKKEKHLEKEIKEQERKATLEIQKGKAKKAEPKKEDPKKVEHKKAEPKKAEPKQVEKEPETPQKEEKKVSPERKEDFLETKVKKLDGPKVVGKIDINEYLQKESNRVKKRQEEKEALKAERKKQKERKKRKRIPKDKVKLDNNKPTNHGKPSGKKPTRKKKLTKSTEVSDVDVQKQIKDTLARLENKKQKSKAAKYRRDKRDAVSKKRQEDEERVEAGKSTLQVNEFASVSELASMMDKPVTEVIMACMSVGLTVSINQRLDAETMTIVVDEFGYDIKFVSAEDTEDIEDIEDSEEDLLPRAPIVTVMGHVDHGKTKLLDYVRHANVVAGEAGGITQHVGAYSVELDNGKRIAFLDTPGHEAFTAMRARGAQVTDIAIIVIAADDDVMPQTIEAINHASAAGVPMVFAINKVDKPTANPEKIKEKLANMNYLVEDWGGKYQSQEISALEGLNVDALLEKVLLEAELLDLKANPDRPAEGTIIESTLDKGRGYVATLLVQKGTLKQGDMVLAGTHFGRVKAMFNERQKRIDETGPSTPAVLLGLNGAPQAGDTFRVMEDESEAKHIASRREQLQREQNLRTQKHITLDEIGRRLALGNFQEINVVVKGDVDGSIEALSDSLEKLSTDELKVNVIHKAVGQITETDVMLASASNAIIIGFQVRPSVVARRLAEKEEIEIRLYSIIYDAINEMKAAMEGMLSPEIKERIQGTAEVQNIFKITKVGTVAGCQVVDGKIFRKSKVRLIRDGIVIYSGDLGSLKRYKDDAKEVYSGQECGLNIENFNDIKVGDMVEAYEEFEVKKTLDN